MKKILKIMLTPLIAITTPIWIVGILLFFIVNGAYDISTKLLDLVFKEK